MDRNIAVNRWTFVFGLSLAANVALVGVWWGRRALAASVTFPSVVTNSIPTADAPADGRTWTRLQGVDDGSLARILAEAGFPIEVRRALVRLRVEQRLAARREAIVAAMPAAYWKATPGGRLVEPVSRAAWDALAREEAAELRRLLGPDAEPELARRLREASYGALPVEKVEALERLHADYAELTNQLRAETLGLTMPGDAERTALLAKEKQADLASLLSPEELAAYEERSSPSATAVKRLIGDMEVTEAEFKQLYALQKDYDERYDGTTTATRRTVVGMELLKEQMGAIFSDERAAVFRLVSDSAYAPVASLVQRLHLPPETTRAVVSYAQTAQATMNRIARDDALTAWQRRDALQALHAESVALLEEKLGPEGVEAYAKASGFWLKNLEVQRSLAASAARSK